MAGRTLVGRVVTLAALLVLVLVLVLSRSSMPAAASDSPCTASPDTVGSTRDKIDPPIVVTPEVASQSRVVNFDAGRKEKRPVFHLKIEPAITQADLAKLRLDVDPLVRTGNDKVETVDFSDMAFTPMRLTNGGSRITFGVCLRPPSDLPAGKYVGVVTLDGPSGVTPTSVSVTANTKNGGLFAGGFILTLVLAFFVLLYKEAAAARATTIAGDAEAMKAEPSKVKRDASAKAAAKWGPAFTVPLGDLGFWFRTLLTLGATFGALYALWENNPTWGDAGTIPSLVTLVGVGLAAVGVRAIISPSSGSAAGM